MQRGNLPAKIKKAVSVYTLQTPLRIEAVSSFFSAPSYEELYFTSLEEAQLYQQQVCPEATLKQEVKLAVEDKNTQGKDRWVLINKTEDMRNSNFNQLKINQGYYSKSVCFAASFSLEEIIRNNPDSVIAVRPCNETYSQSDSEMGGSTSSTITYEGTSTVDDKTRFLCIQGYDRHFIERGGEITMTSARNLVLDHEISELQARLRARQIERADYPSSSSGGRSYK